MKNQKIGEQIKVVVENWSFCSEPVYEENKNGNLTKGLKFDSTFTFDNTMSSDETKHIVEFQDDHDSFKGSYDTSKNNESDVTYSIDHSPSFIEEMDA
ncbi:hypothetical protein LIER_39486 [Lithospermum erythrorhizon]|uniref:Uncharacterized protein n=1 Tax=Lithospermum erythrorhizon TaxID=34254 RepID=A0AAV3QGR1_LITER